MTDESQRSSWRCRHGIHRFVFVSMTNARQVLGFGFHCDLVEKCDRCGLVRMNTSAKIPKRVRIGHASTERIGDRHWPTTLEEINAR